MIFFSDIRRFRRRVLFPAATVFIALGAPLCAAQPMPSDTVYPYRVEPSIIESIKKGPNAQVYAYRQIIAMLKSDTPMDAISYSTINAHVLMYGKYNSPRGVVDIELRGDIRDGVLEIDFPLGRVDAVLFEWEETAARPDALKSLKPRVRSLTFREVSGFRSIYSIERTLPYQLTVDIPYNPVTKNLMPPQPDFKDVAEFVKAVETNEHSKIMLANNATGLPAYITAGGETHTLVAGYLLNSVKWNGRDSRWEYAYEDELKRVKGFPEVRRLLKDPQVKAFVEDGETRVKGFGGEKTGYSFMLSKEDGRRLDATIVGRRIVVKPVVTPRP
jgi:hypothetical protein